MCDHLGTPFDSAPSPGKIGVEHILCTLTGTHRVADGSLRNPQDGP